MMNLISSIKTFYSFSLALLGIFSLVIIIYTIIDCLDSKLSDTEKLIWIILLISLNIIGVLLYYIYIKRNTKMVTNTKVKRLIRSNKNKMIAGVCGGIGEYMNVDPTIIRLIWVLFSLTGAGVLAYIIAWIIIPEK